MFIKNMLLSVEVDDMVNGYYADDVGRRLGLGDGKCCDVVLIHYRERVGQQSFLMNAFEACRHYLRGIEAECIVVMQHCPSEVAVGDDTDTLTVCSIFVYHGHPEVFVAHLYHHLLERVVFCDPWHVGRHAVDDATEQLSS